MSNFNLMKPTMICIALLACCLCSFGQKVPEKTGSNINQADAQEALDFHNQVRKDVGTKPLRWSEELAAYAQQWADSLAMNDCDLRHRAYVPGKKNYGENIFWGTDIFVPVDAPRSWYNEIKKYTYGPLTPSNWNGVGHYTQMVWKTTEYMGMGAATCASGSIIVVANYDPPGNRMGEKPY
jgi:pathogenesis-related protein 1